MTPHTPPVLSAYKRSVITQLLMEIPIRNGRALAGRESGSVSQLRAFMCVSARVCEAIFDERSALGMCAFECVRFLFVRFARSVAVLVPYIG